MKKLRKLKKLQEKQEFKKHRSEEEMKSDMAMEMEKDPCIIDRLHE